MEMMLNIFVANSVGTNLNFTTLACVFHHMTCNLPIILGIEDTALKKPTWIAGRKSAKW